MKTQHFFTSACRHCRYYNPEGRRGGMCQQLGVPVQGKWKSCSLAVSPFASPWDDLDEIMILEKSLSLNCLDNCSVIEASSSEEVVVY